MELGAPVHEEDRRWQQKRASRWYYKTNAVRPQDLQEGGNAAVAASILNKTMSLVLRILKDDAVSPQERRPTMGNRASWWTYKKRHTRDDR
jgi:hypothetical protein